MPLPIPRQGIVLVGMAGCVSLDRMESAATIQLEPHAVGSRDVRAGGTSRDALADAAEMNFVERPFNCAEAVLAAFAEARGEDPSSIVGFGSAYGQGMGQGLTCGAMAAALMLIGRLGQEQAIGKKEIRARASAFFRDFEAEFGHSECRVLSGHDCNDPTSAPFDSRQCGKFLRFAAQGVHRAAGEGSGVAVDPGRR